MPKINLRNLCALTLFALLIAQNLAHSTEYLSPRVLSLGGAGRAAPLFNDSIYLNPSYASFTPSYNISTGYTWFTPGRSYNASIQDSRTELFQAGIGFTRREQNGAINFGASKIAVEHLGFGLGAKLIIDDGTNNITTDSTFSASFLAASWFTSAIIIDNIFQSDAGLARNLYRTFYLATKFTTLEVVQIYIDPFYSPSYTSGAKSGYSAGIELGLMADFFARFGKFQDADIPYLNTRGSGIGLGLGWVGPKVAFDYAYHHVTQNDLNLGIVSAHAISMTVFFN